MKKQLQMELGWSVGVKKLLFIGLFTDIHIYLLQKKEEKNTMNAKASKDIKNIVLIKIRSTSSTFGCRVFIARTLLLLSLR
jgi:hypothetical protein